MINIIFLFRYGYERRHEPSVLTWDAFPALLAPVALLGDRVRIRLSCHFELYQYRVS